jgi:tetratricopeptide (TPR) repeat protein
MDGRIMKYNPAFLSKEELVEKFVVRHGELDLIVQAIRENTGASNQHLLIIGPRGIGKTMLVLRAVEEVRRQKDLSERWYPLVFAEESYQVTTPGEFWLEAIFHLAQKTQDPKRKAAHEELQKELDENRLRERALAQLLDFADAQRKRLVLVVENLNTLLGAQMTDDDGWVLRHTLLHEPRIMLLTTATSQFEQTDNSGKAMFELFRTIKLDPLGEDDCCKMWTSISGEEPGDNRIRPIQILTGGNPRLVAIISSFGARLSFRELMTDLTRLVDDHTEYFKSHLDGLAPTERKVYLALVELWNPVGTREVAQAARLDVNKTSSFLQRLKERGAVVEVGGKGRKKLYQVAERMYNIYYLMRRHGAPSQRVRAVVNFMVAFYSETELVDALHRIAEEACVLQPEARIEHYLAFEEILRCRDTSRIWDTIMQVTPASLTDMFSAQVTPELAKLTDWLRELPPQFEAVRAMFSAAIALAERQEYDEALLVYDEIIRQSGEMEDMEFTSLIAAALNNKSEILKRQGKQTEGMRAKCEAMRRITETGQEIAKLDAAIDSATQIVSLTKEKRYAEAATLCDDMVGRFSDMRDTNFLRVVIVAINSKAMGLRMEKRHAEAIQCYDKILKMIRGRRDSPFIARAASALVEKGAALVSLGKPEEAMTCYERVIRRFHDRSDPEVKAEIALAFAGKGIILGNHRKCVMAREAFEKAVALDPDNYHAALMLARCLEGQGRANGALTLIRTHFAKLDQVKEYLGETAGLVVRLAAKGYAQDIINMLRESPSIELFEPLLVGLRLYLGEEVIAAAEIMEVAKDVVKRIETRRAELESLHLDQERKEKRGGGQEP